MYVDHCVSLLGKQTQLSTLNTGINTGYPYHIIFYLPGTALMVKAVALLRVPREPSCGLVIIPEHK